MAEQEKMRLTMHNGRVSSEGAFLAKHNDRDFDYQKDDHINAEKTPDNITWHCYSSTKDLTFDECERLFYEQHFYDHLLNKNDEHLATGHPANVRTMDEYRRSRQTCPEETEFMIGKQGDVVNPVELFKVVVEFVNWEATTYPNIKTLNIALHIDEEGQAHIHQRKVWIAHDKNGDEMVGQKKALEEMGIERPKPTKDRTRHNNEKVTYTKQTRDKMFEICKAAGFDLETKAKDPSKNGLTLLEYKRRQEEEKTEKLKQEQKDLEAHTRLLQENLDKRAEELKKTESDALKALQDREEEFDERVKRKEAELEQKEKNLADKAAEKERDFQAREDKLEAQQKIIDDALRALKDREEKFDERVKRKEAELEQKEKNLANKAAEKERDFQAREDKLEAQKKAAKQDITDFTEKANKSIRETYENAYNNADEIEKMKKTANQMARVMKAMDDSGMKIKGVPALKYFQYKAGITKEEHANKPPIINPIPQYRHIPTGGETEESKRAEGFGY